MPILWRYALHSYFRVFSLSLCTFIAVLLLTRFQEIARFTALSGHFLKTGTFVFYQLPSILPIAIPISSLLASFLLFQRLSRSHELTALRALRMNFLTILAPILLTSILLSLFNFCICSSLVPFCRRESKTLFFHATSDNPLLLLQRQKLLQIKHAYLNMKAKNDAAAKDLIFITYNGRNQRLNLFSAQKLRLENGELWGQNLGLVSTLNSDTLIIENQSSMTTSAPLLSKALKKKHPHLDLNAHSLKMLRIKGNKKSYIEILKRISLSLSVFSFTLIGSIFAIEQGRIPKKRNLYFALALVFLILTGYLLGGQMKQSMPLAFVICFMPHLFSWLGATWHLCRISRGLV